MRSNLHPWGEVRFGARRCHVALPVLPGELKAATLTPVRRAPGEPAFAAVWSGEKKERVAIRSPHVAITRNGRGGC
jgi:hypothetical protein